MPKIVTEEHKEIAKEAIRQKTEELIKEIGIKNITVSNICNAVPIGKGTFYYYYESKEILLYEIIKGKEEMLFKQIMDYAKYDLSVEQKIIRALTEVYIGEGSMASHVTPEEIEKLISKLPEEYVKRKKLSGQKFFEASMRLLGINPVTCNMRVLGELLDCVNFLASRNNEYGDEAKEEALQMMIRSIAVYMQRYKE